MATSTGIFKVIVLKNGNMIYEADYTTEPTFETIVADLKAWLEKKK